MTLQVLEEFRQVRKGRSHKMVKVRCSCGGTFTAFLEHLRSGHTKSCGCHRREASRKRATTHGMSSTPEFKVWCGMRRRCTDTKDKRWADYGGRGIKVCARWQSFENFLADMGPRPSPKHSIDRINNDGGYEPANCRWATGAEQQQNRSDRRLITFNGRTQSLTMWAAELNMKISTLHQRLRVWPLELALTSPLRSNQHWGPKKTS